MLVKDITCEKRYYKDSFKQYMYNEVKKEYKVFSDTLIVKDNNDIIIAILIKNFFSDNEYNSLEKFIFSETFPKTHKHEISISKDHELQKLKAKVFDFNKQYNHNICKFDTLHIFNNHLVDIHQDSVNKNIKNLFLLKGDTVNSLTVFPEFEMAFDIQNKDCLFFDTNLWHYACTQKMISPKHFRYALYFE